MTEIGFGIFGFANWAIRVFYVCLLFLIPTVYSGLRLVYSLENNKVLLDVYE